MKSSKTNFMLTFHYKTIHLLFFVFQELKLKRINKANK